MKLLLVDDSERVRAVIKRMVGNLCEAIYECADGAEALAAYDRFHPDWVFMDIRMKQVDGLQATRQIIAAHKDARIVIVTNLNDKDLRETVQEAGACGYVLKEDLTALRQILTAPP